MPKRFAAFQFPAETRTRFALLQGETELVEIDNFENQTPVNDKTIPLDSIELLPPLPQTPSKIIAVGLNYPAHIDEMKHENVPSNPILFLKAPSTLLAPFKPIIGLSSWGRIDYEGELAVVIGKTCKNASEATALDYVLGYTLANDVTARALQRQDTQWGRAKNFDTFCPLGPYLLQNEGQNPAAFHLQTQVDGEVRQDGDVSQMRFSIPFLIAYISNIMTLYPGDLILTGTPQGVSPLEKGQTVRIGVPEIGWLENPFQLVAD